MTCAGYQCSAPDWKTLKKVKFLKRQFYKFLKNHVFHKLATDEESSPDHSMIIVSFWMWITSHTPQCKFSPFCNRKFSLSSSSGAKLKFQWHGIQDNKFISKCYQRPYWRFKKHWKNLKSDWSFGLHSCTKNCTDVSSLQVAMVL